MKRLKKNISPLETSAGNANNVVGSGTPVGKRRARKRKRCEIIINSDSDLESEFDDCDMNDAIAIEKKLRTIASTNNFSDDEMRRLLQKFVKNEHILAFVTLKAEDELAREKLEADQRTIMIMNTPSVSKFTRAKARELNRTPAITLPSLKESSAGGTEIAALIKDDLHSDEDDGEYTFNEEDFISDDDPNTTASDMESNPRTPQTPFTQTEYEDSPVKFTPDGCFKLPFDKHEDMRIAARTRSKFCLQKTTIEDLQSEFIPPDVEITDMQDSELGINDEEWMQFLNDFSKPLNNNFTGDDDDPVNDPEYVAAEKVTVDAEELRDVNISKKELTELVVGLFEGLTNEGLCFESVELETPQKFFNNSTNEKLQTPTFEPTINKSPSKTPTTISMELNAVTRQIDFDAPQQLSIISNIPVGQHCVSDATISSTNIAQNEYSFHPDVMSTPDIANDVNTTIIPIASLEHTDRLPNTISIPDNALNIEPELIAIPVPGQPNSFQLARILATGGELSQQNITLQSPEKPTDTRYTIPYDTNYTSKYISIKRHVYSEYMQKFNETYAITTTSTTTTTTAVTAATQNPSNSKEFTQEQHDLLQQQLRTHVQLLTQNYMQFYCHPILWKYAQKPRGMLMELNERAAHDASFNAWNLSSAIELITGWEQELSVDSEENREMMQFLHKEVERTKRNTRQIARLPPRIMDRMLDSSVFMYPEYLPRIAFTSKKNSFHVFAPAESHLIAKGLEKHMTIGRKVQGKKRVTLRRACEIISREMDRSKTQRRIWDHIKALRNASYYNPVKYFFEHGRAPPTEYQIRTFPNNIVLPPRERVSELPLGWRKYLEQKQTTAAQQSTTPNVTASKEARSTYLQLVKEVVGEELQLPENLLLEAELEQSVKSADATPTSRKKTKSAKKVTNEKQQKQNLTTINVNYIFGADAAANILNSTSNSTIAPVTPGPIQQSNTESNANYFALNNDANGHNTQQTGSIDTTISSNNIPTNTIQPIAYNFDLNTNTLHPLTIHEEESHKTKSTQKKLTDYFEIQETNNSSRSCENLESSEKSNECQNTKRLQRHHKTNKKKKKFHGANLTSQLFTNYNLTQQKQLLRYRHKPLLQFYYRNFKALELYTDLLIELQMFCKNSSNNNHVAVINTNGATTTTTGSPTGASKRARQIDEEGGVRTKKVNRQEENFRNMLLPDSPEDANRKDAIYAFNFYEKVEEVLKASSSPEDCKRFNHILKTFDPKHDRVADLYYKLENLLMPDHPDLAQVFLTFLLPSEAIEIGKFFEHFMANNMTTFINKLNIYFHKQPAQIRKVYNCLGELAEEEDVTMEKIESRIMPLLKGNQFLVDWFKQLFPASPSPDRLLAAPEHVNIKDVINNQSGEFIETVIDTLETPSQEPQKRHCQLRYINGRIFYGSKILLPAKLSFMAQCYQLDSMDEPTEGLNSNDSCVHAIREHGEQRLIDALSAPIDCSSGDDNDKSEEEDTSKALLIDTTSDEENCSSTIDACDDAALHAHAVRLNPSYYGYTNTFTSTPNSGSNSQQIHHPNAKKSSLNYAADDVKLSPRKQQQLSNLKTVASATAAPASNLPNTAPTATPITTSATPTNTQRERRKSPIKKHAASSKSPNAGANKQRATQPMVVIHERNSAIACAKKLKSLIEDSSESEIDTKANIPIVAKAKHKVVANELQTQQHFKTERNDELEFLPENAEISMTLSRSPARKLEMKIDLTEEETQQTADQQHHVVSSTHFDSDEDCKLDIVASLATVADEEPCSSTAFAAQTRVSASLPIAWTRDEDKIILIEMKLGSRNRDDLFQRIKAKLPSRSLFEITGRHQFLIDFLSKLQGN